MERERGSSEVKIGGGDNRVGGSQFFVLKMDEFEIRFVSHAENDEKLKGNARLYGILTKFVGKKD